MSIEEFLSRFTEEQRALLKDQVAYERYWLRHTARLEMDGASTATVGLMESIDRSVALTADVILMGFASPFSRQRLREALDGEIAIDRWWPFTPALSDEDKRAIKEATLRPDADADDDGE